MSEPEEEAEEVQRRRWIRLDDWHEDDRTFTEAEK